LFAAYPYFIYNGLSRQYILSTDFQDSEIRPAKLYASAADKILISNVSGNYTESNISAIFAAYPYFIYNGASRQYILNTDIQVNEIDSTKIKAANAYRIVGSTAIGSGMSEVQMTKANVDNFFDIRSVDYTKLY